MIGPLQAVPASLVLAALILTSAAPAAPTRTTTKTDGNGTTTITQSQTSGDGSSRRQITITRRSSSSGKRTTKKPVYKVGEMVKVDWGNEVQDAEVVGFSRTGWIKVRFEHNGIEMTPTLPPDHIWRVPEKKVTAADKKLRTWTSRSGKFTIKAKFVKLDEDDNLTLEKEDGKTLVVALDKLTEGDEKLARRLAGYDE